MQDLFSKLGTTEGIFVLLGILVIAGGITWMLLASKANLAGGSKTRARGMLQRYAVLNSCKLLDNVTLPTKSGVTAHADHVLIGYFGVLVLNVVGEVGSYYGDDVADTWAIVLPSGEKRRIASPLKAGESAMDAIREVFQKNDIYRIPMEQLVVVLPSFNDKREFCVKPNLPVVNVRKLVAKLSAGRFQEDKGVDVEKITAAIAAAGK